MFYNEKTPINFDDILDIHQTMKYFMITIKSAIIYGVIKRKKGNISSHFID
jgi:hypothetical protein